jgi:preprotein translocase subunit SecG
MNTTWTDILIDVLLFVYVIDCLFMGLVIMMQRSKQEGLGAAFGGGLTESVWGAQTSQVLVKATVWAAIIFFTLSLTLARLYSHRATLIQAGSTVEQELLKPGIPASTNAAPVTIPATNAGSSVPATVPPVAPVSPAPASSATSTTNSASPASATPAKPASK